MAQVVTRRTREIGIRMALGARKAQVLALVVKRVAVVLAAGLAAGTLGAAAVPARRATVIDPTRALGAD